MKLRKVLSLFVALVMMLEVLPLSSLAAEIEDATENVEVAAEAVEEAEEAEETVEEVVEEEAAVLLGASADETEEDSSDESEIATVSEDVTIIDSGTCGDDLTWILASDGVLTISGTGDMTDYSSIYSVPWYDNKSSITSVVIESGVTSIGVYAFYDCTSLTSIDIPGSVTSIGYYAFGGCTSLKSIVIPDGVTSISDHTFFKCSSLESINIPDGVTSIGEWAFAHCSSLTSIDIPDGVTSIGEGAFDNCASLTSIYIPDSVTSIGDAFTFADCSSLTSIDVGSGNTKYLSQNGILFSKDMSELLCYPSGKGDTAYVIPDSVTSIGYSAFCGCTSLMSVVIPDSVTSIDNDAFYECTSLTSIVIPDGVTSINFDTFGGCTSLTSIDIPDSVTSIDSYAFAHCSSLTSIVIPDGVTSIIYNTFYECTSLTSVEIPDSVTSIGSYVFYKCTSLTSIDIPDGVTSISHDSFYRCTSLESIIIPNSVTSIGSYAFYRCTSLSDVYFYGTEEEWNEIEISSNNSPLLNATIHYLDGDEETDPYVASGTCGDNLTWSLSSDGVLTISGEGDMDSYVTSSQTPWYSYREQINTVIVESGVTSIGTRALSYLTNLNYVTIPTTVTKVNNYAFDGSTNISDVYYEGSELRWMGILVGTSNSYFTSATIHYLGIAETEISGACGDNLTWTVTSDGVLTISGTGDMYDYGTSLSTFAPWHGYSSFITSLVVESSVTSLGYDAFYWSKNLKTVTLPTTVTSINTYSFDACSEIVIVYYEGTVAEWEEISIKTGNSYLTDALIRCSDGWINYSDTATVSGTFYYESNIVSGGASYDFYYSDSWFFNDPYTTYQSELVQMSIKLATASIPPESDATDYDTIFDLMSKIGMEDMVFSYEKPEYDTIGYAIGSKTIISSTGEISSLILVTVRSGGYGVEWGGNFRVTSAGTVASQIQYVLNNSEAHTGFAIAANTVLEGIQDYVDTHNLMDDVKIWICGYSRGAATANLVGATIIDNVAGNSDDITIDGLDLDGIYTFCFECPLNTTDDNVSDEIYSSILNFVNPIDLVPMVAPSKWGFKRYGTTLYLSSFVNTGYYYSEYRSAMRETYTDILMGTSAYSSRSVASAAVSTLYAVENVGQYSAFTNLVDTLAEIIEVKKSETLLSIGSVTILNGRATDWETHFTEIQDDLMALIAKLLSNGEDDIDYLNLIYQIVDLCGDNASQNATLLATVAGYAAFIGKAHYPELSLAWLDTDACQSYLESQFTSSENYASHYRVASINCPVDIEVYDSNGSLVARIISDEVQDIENGVGAYIDSDDQKVLILPTDMEYKVYLTATDSGEVTYTVEQYNFDSGETEKVVSYFEVDVETGDELVGTVENLTVVDEAVYPLTLNDTEVVATVSQTGNDVDEFYVSIGYTDGGTVSGGGTYTVGEYAKVTATADEDYTFTGWYVSDNLVSTDAEYRFLVDSEITIIAVFTASVDYSELISEAETTLSSTDWTLTQSDVESATGSTTADKIATLIDAILAGLGIDDSVTVTFTITDITEAIAGDATDTDGTGGSFTINFTISAGNESDTLTEIGAITATAYVHTHSLTRVEAVDATCTAEGNTEYWYCSGCDKYYSDENAENEITLADTVTAKIAHNYEAVVTEPTCTEGGYTTYTCSVCKDSYVADEVEATGHSYEAVVTEPTCTEGGYTTYTCSVCKDSYVADETEALGHDYTSEVTKEATCTEAGVMTYTCTRGDDSYTVEIPATGHTEAEAIVENEVATTCTTDGSYDSVVYCSVCGEELLRETIVVPAAHTAGTAVRENIVEATRTAEGSYDLVTYCTVCGEEISRETVTVPATGVDMITVWLRTPADYSAVNNAIAKANALNQDDYTNFSAVTDAIDAVVWTYNALMQSYVDKMAEDIENAIANLIPVGTTFEVVEIQEPIEDTNTDTEEDVPSPFLPPIPQWRRSCDLFELPEEVHICLVAACLGNVSDAQVACF